MSWGFRSRLLRALKGLPRDNIVVGEREPLPELAAARAQAETGERLAERVQVFQQGRIRLIYETTYRPGRPLVVIFSGVDTQAARCSTSYYGLHWQLDASVVHIHDNFGAHGNYLLQTAGNAEIRWATANLLRLLMKETDTKPKDLWLVGSSKGATTALCMALTLKVGNCIAAEPQILLGDFLFPEVRDWHTLEELRAISYAMMGRVDPEDKPALNNIVPTIIRTRLHQYRGKALVIFGKRTGYYQQHIFRLDEALRQIDKKDRKLRKSLRVTLREEPFDKHLDAIPVFLDTLFGYFGALKEEGMAEPEEGSATRPEEGAISGGERPEGSGKAPDKALDKALDKAETTSGGKPA